MRLALICLLFLSACALPAGPRGPAERLCDGEPTCMEKLLRADTEEFKTPREAARFGLAWAHARFPDVEAAGVVMETPNGGFTFYLAGIGDAEHVQLDLPVGVVAFFHTHVKGMRQCSRLDEDSAAKANRHFGRKVWSYAQHRLGPVVECVPTPAR